MQQGRLDSLLHGLTPETASVVREFARRPQDEQLVYLFIEIQALKRPKGLQERLYEFGFAGALIAYVLFDKKDHLPFIGGGR